MPIYRDIGSSGFKVPVPMVKHKISHPADSPYLAKLALAIHDYPYKIDEPVDFRQFMVAYHWIAKYRVFTAGTNRAGAEIESYIGHLDLPFGWNNRFHNAFFLANFYLGGLDRTMDVQNFGIYKSNWISHYFRSRALHPQMVKHKEIPASTFYFPRIDRQITFSSPQPAFDTAKKLGAYFGTRCSPHLANRSLVLPTGILRAIGYDPRRRGMLIDRQHDL